MMIKTGDIIGFSAGDLLGMTINVSALGWPFPPARWRGLTHVGIVVIDEFNRPILWESTTRCDLPCLCCGKKHNGVKSHVLTNRVAGYSGYVWHYPLRRSLDSVQHRLAAAFVKNKHGTPYDAAGAAESRTLFLGWLTRPLLSEDLEELFCSEFVAAAWVAAEVWDAPNASVWNPNRLARTAVNVGLTHSPGRLLCRP